MRTLGGALLGDCDFFFLRQFGEFHAQNGAEVVVGGSEDVFELPAGVGRHDCERLSETIHTSRQTGANLWL